MRHRFLHFLSYMTGVTVGMIYVFYLKAPVMINIFSGYATLKLNYELIFAINFKVLAMIFFAVIPFYIAAVIIPAYRLASIDTYEVFR